jgi:hypothetical protein
LYDLPGSRLPCNFNILVSRRQNLQVAFDEVFGKERRACFERFPSHVPVGVEAGRWVFGIDLEQSAVRLPFDL